VTNDSYIEPSTVTAVRHDNFFVAATDSEVFSDHHYLFGDPEHVACLWKYSLLPGLAAAPAGLTRLTLSSGAAGGGGARDASS